MTPFIAHLLPAAALGLFVAIPFGPIGLMCVQRTLAFGSWFGVASGMGAATAHGMFSCLAVVSGTVLTQMTLALHTPLRITGGIVLILMGLRTILVSTDAAHGATQRGNNHGHHAFRRLGGAPREGAHCWKREAEMPQAEIRVYHSSRVRLRGFVLKTTARLKSCELTVNT
ncbi:hypothetical protein J6524_30485 [Bradyrhizobium sp. WSM 1738]|uniref:LysE family transporter n=1 Tax=Bradyrhizobium hereditatis TaxID=2821405 RepID=UPI001CE26E9E|nr:LysE family transporter [Bradyrhizobium hereditatis]MCA6119176.1 hypothetical protein [Bradyrhizobium hereditatis]